MQKEVLPKEVIFNLVPILYFIIPIVLGIVTDLLLKKLSILQENNLFLNNTYFYKYSLYYNYIFYL